MRVLRVITVAFILHASLLSGAALGAKPQGNPAQSAIASAIAIRNPQSPIDNRRQPEPWYDRVLRRINPSTLTMAPGWKIAEWRCFERACRTPTSGTAPW